MDKQNKYFLLAALLFVALLVIQFTDIYGNPGWFKWFLLILSLTFFLTGFANKRRKDESG